MVEKKLRPAPRFLSQDEKPHQSPPQSPNQSFLDSILAAFPAEQLYQMYPDPFTAIAPVAASSSHKFRMARRNLMDQLLTGNPIQRETSEAYAIELITCLALQNALRVAGFVVQLSPQSVEMSTKKQKGVDLIISDLDDTMYLGIDIKFRRGRSPWNRDGYGWNAQQLTPYLYLSLGDFRLQMDDFAELAVRDWLRSVAVPGLNDSKQIPGWRNYSFFVIDRIEKSLFGALKRLESSLQGDSSAPMYGFPADNLEQEIFLEKIAIMQSLFVELKLNQPKNG